MVDFSSAAIRTSDQRLRVFVSSTLTVLSAERESLRGTIERLRLTPVMFELGARPYPPRDLYRAYVDQSDVFVGVCRSRPLAHDRVRDRDHAQAIAPLTATAGGAAKELRA